MIGTQSLFNQGVASTRIWSFSASDGDATRSHRAFTGAKGSTIRSQPSQHRLIGGGILADMHQTLTPTNKAALQELLDKTRNGWKPNGAVPW